MPGPRIVLAVDSAWESGIAPLVMAVVGCIAAGLLVLFGTLAFVHVALRVDEDCLEVRCGHIGVPRRRIPLSHVAGAEFVAHVTPRHWGGWGYRWRPEKGTAVVVRRGEGVILRLWTATPSPSPWTTPRRPSRSSRTGCGRRRPAPPPDVPGCPGPAVRPDRRVRRDVTGRRLRRVTVTATTVGEPDRTEPRTEPASRAGRLARRLAPAAASALAGVLLYVSFPPRTLWWLALPAFAVLGAVLRGRGWKAGLGLGYLFGLGFLLPLLVWTGVEVGPGPWLALVVIEAVFVAVVGAGVAAVSRLPAWPVWAAAVWIAGEAARARVPFEGFPWGKVAFGQADGVFLPLAALGGTPVLGFAVVLCGFGLCEAVRLAVAARRTRTVRRGAAALALLSLAAPLVAALAARPLVTAAAEDGTATIAVIQGNVPRAGLDFNAQRRAVLDHHARETERLAAEVRAGKVPRPDFVLWPENSSDIDPFANPTPATSSTARPRRSARRSRSAVSCSATAGSTTSRSCGTPSKAPSTPTTSGRSSRSASTCRSAP